MKNNLSVTIESKNNLPNSKLNNLLKNYHLCCSDVDAVLLLISIFNKTLSNSLDENIIKAQLNLYNFICDDLNNAIAKFEHSFSEFNTMVAPATKKSQTTAVQDNNTLLISEKENSVFLPYKAEDVQKLVDHHKYKNVEDVIKKRYTLPLSRFHNSFVARFKEGYHLVKTKEKGSFSQAFDLGLELMCKSNLHPAVIYACKNLKELDFFLDCLETNRLTDFTCFEVKFEMFPSVLPQETLAI